MTDTTSTVTAIRTRLFALREESYRRFQNTLLPTVDPDRILGVRAPRLRRLARELRGTDATTDFLAALPHTYLEEDLLHAYLLAETGDTPSCLAALEAFLPYVDNWAVCDSLRPACLRKYTARLDGCILEWLASPHPYTVRFAIEVQMLWVINEPHKVYDHARIAAIVSDEYYVNMMIAWYFATALAKQWDEALPYLSNHRLSPWVHRKTIQKAIESRMIRAEQKELLRGLR